jgi:hypothetical protein
MFVPENGRDGYWTLVQYWHHRVVNLLTNDFAEMLIEAQFRLHRCAFASMKVLLCTHSRGAARRPEQISQFHLVIAPQVDRNEIRLFALGCVVDLIHHSIP